MGDTPELTDQKHRTQQTVLLFSTFVIAICGLIYELLVSTLSSYLIGDSVYQFSLVIGLFMTSMGIGAWYSRFILNELPKQFVRLQLWVALLGGLSAPFLFFAFTVIGNYTPLLFVIVIVLGSMLGIEIPLIIRILKSHNTLKANLSNVFTADYIGALIAALLFPLVLIPQLGLMQSGFFIGMINAVIGGLALYVFRHEIKNAKLLGFFTAGILLLLGIGLLNAKHYVSGMESRLYQDNVIYAEDSPFQQRLILTKRGERMRFYINGALQFDSYDEYRYHESLVHPAMGLLQNVEQVLILGGGDGLAARELLKYPDIKHITIVDLDPAVTKLFQNNAVLQTLNDQSLQHAKVTVINQDAWKYLEQHSSLYDAIFIDLPDPNNISLSRLYTDTFYKLVKANLSQQGIIVTQATSPLFARRAFWSIEKTLGSDIEGKAIGENWQTLPYHIYIPSFGEWGFVMTSRRTLSPENIKLKPNDYRFLSQEMLPNLFDFPKDMEKLEVETNQLSSHPVLRYYEDGWKRWYK